MSLGIREVLNGIKSHNIKLDAPHPHLTPFIKLTKSIAPHPREPLVSMPLFFTGNYKITFEYKLWLGYSISTHFMIWTLKAVHHSSALCLSYKFLHQKQGEKMYGFEVCRSASLSVCHAFDITP